jgi:hypothetical protein
MLRQIDCALRGGFRATRFRAPITACTGCALREQCLRNPDSTRNRQVAIVTQRPQRLHTERMRERIDSETGRALYDRRLGVVEPVFGNLRYNKNLARFTLRGRTKVDGQWKLFALVHNIEKLANYRKAA